MNKLVITFASLTLFFSCGTESEAPVKEKKEFDMYKTSEMASLMRQMHHINSQLKEKIANGEELGEFPESFERILEASMTDNQVMDEFFKSHAQSFLDAQRAIYAKPEQAKELFNGMVESCLECHRVKCAGPIPKIEKLILN
jgi:uncharacterized protein YktA (UPF0223 family)